MASSVEDLEKTLNQVSKLASQNHIGASDRKRTLQRIRDLIEECLAK